MDIGELWTHTQGKKWITKRHRYTFAGMEWTGKELIKIDQSKWTILICCVCVRFCDEYACAGVICMCVYSHFCDGVSNAIRKIAPLIYVIIKL